MSQSIKKKLVALIIAGVMAVPMVGFAQEGQLQMVGLEETIGTNTEVIESTPADDQEEKQNEYIKYKGIISQVNKMMVELAFKSLQMQMKMSMEWYSIYLKMYLYGV